MGHYLLPAYILFCNYLTEVGQTAKKYLVPGKMDYQCEEPAEGTQGVHYLNGIICVIIPEVLIRESIVFNMFWIPGSSLGMTIFFIYKQTLFNCRTTNIARGKNSSVFVIIEH